MRDADRRAGAERRARRRARRRLAGDGRRRRRSTASAARRCRPRFNAAAAIQAGHLDIVVAAGVESMSRVPMGSNLGADGLAGPQPEDRRALADRPAGHLRRGDREGVGALAAMISTRTRSSRTAARLPRSTPGCSSARSCRSTSVQPAQRAVRGRRDAAPRHVGREARVVAARVLHRGRGRHRRQLEPDRRRRCRDARRERGGVPRPGLEPRGRFVSFGLAGVDPFRMLHGNPQACARGA